MRNSPDCSLFLTDVRSRGFSGLRRFSGERLLAVVDEFPAETAFDAEVAEGDVMSIMARFFLNS
jgi:hypothetical protein